MDRIRVAVLMGGESPEREVSLRSGAQVLAQLDKERYEPVGVTIDEKGKWAFLQPGSLDPDPTLLAGFLTPGRAVDMLAMLHVDIVFIALHGPYGEDGTVQGMLELHHIPYTGSRVAGSALAMDKNMARKVLKSSGIPIPEGLSINRSVWSASAKLAFTKELEGKISPPWFVKPNASGSSVGICRVEKAEGLASAIEAAFKVGEEVLIEKFCPGVEVTCAVLGNSNGQLQALPPIEIVPRREGFFTYQEKYDPTGAEEICPPKNLGEAQIRKIEELALLSHRALGCDGMSRVDMIVQGDKISVLELNTIPGLTERSLLPRAASVADISFPKLLDRLIQLGFERFGVKNLENT